VNRRTALDRVVRSTLWSDRPEVGTHPSQTRVENPASVSAEGGGTVTPTLGGGIGFSREQKAGACRGERRGG
jgi:hypothetical protein